MSQQSHVARSFETPRSGVSVSLLRVFYTAAGALMLALAFVGFNRFYVHGGAYPDRPITPPIRGVVIAHGVSMTLWLVLLFVQPLLVVIGKRRLHMALGRMGAVLAGLILILGLWVAVRSAAVTPPEAKIWGMTPDQFMTVPFISAWIFAGFVAVGVYYRRRPEIHRPMMLVATLSAMSAAISRIDALNGLYAGTVWERILGPFFLTLALGVLLLVVRSVLTRKVDRRFAIGLAVLIVADLLIIQIAPTAAWARFAAAVAH